MLPQAIAVIVAISSQAVHVLVSGLAAEQLASLQLHACRFDSSIVINFVLGTTLEVAFSACSVCRCGLAMALVHMWIIALTPVASSPPVVWVVGSVPFRTVSATYPPPPPPQKQS